ncbi:MAG TPA: hypothetical protein VF691_19195 [Cytophagaceae bacterium]|jgi:hypothetical protein
MEINSFSVALNCHCFSHFEEKEKFAVARLVSLGNNFEEAAVDFGCIAVT